MKRDDYLADSHVASFVQWAGHLVRGKWGLEHAYQGKGPRFQCSTLFEAFQQYRWPDSRNGESFEGTVNRFNDYRYRFNHIGVIESDADRQAFVIIAQETARWGGINNLDVSSSKHWGQMQPLELQRHIVEIKSKLDPGHADADELPASLSMSSGFSKIYAALIPGLPIYDSRVACALTCLIRLYEQDRKVATAGDVLSFPIPAHRGSNRCDRPAIRHDQGKRYAVANLKCAWLLQGLLKQAGDFASVPEAQMVDALQSALFMLGYARLADDAVVKPR